MILYNYLTRKKEEFVPLKPGRVGLYTCGPTVYNVAHIGNFRTYIFEDVLRRALERRGFRVIHIMNLTDVDDKTIRDSRAAGKSLTAFTRIYAREFFRDQKSLNILPASRYPRATEHVPAMVRLISALLKKGIAYRADDGVYFSIRTFPRYGRLSRLARRSLKPGARVSADEYDKAEANDFALWKFKKPGEPSWKAPFGAGRPGWHIECSAMSMQYLGPTFDIHAGGIDLLFPHHEDEIAQSEAATGKPFARYFVEGAHLAVDGKKMSKSLGNMYSLRDVAGRGFSPLDFRYFVLGAHYRSELNFTWEALGAARTARLRAAEVAARLRACRASATLKEENEALKVITYLTRAFNDAIADDLNTPKALAALSELVHYGNSLIAMNRCAGRSANMILALMKEFDRVLAVDLRPRRAVPVPDAVRSLAARREDARRKKDWAEADRLRHEIAQLGYEIDDRAEGPRIRAKNEPAGSAEH